MKDQLEKLEAAHKGYLARNNQESVNSEFTPNGVVIMTKTRDENPTFNVARIVPNMAHKRFDVKTIKHGVTKDEAKGVYKSQTVG